MFLLQQADSHLHPETQYICTYICLTINLVFISWKKFKLYTSQFFLPQYTLILSQLPPPFTHHPPHCLFSPEFSLKNQYISCRKIVKNIAERILLIFMFILQTKGDQLQNAFQHTLYYMYTALRCKGLKVHELYILQFCKCILSSTCVIVKWTFQCVLGNSITEVQFETNDTEYIVCLQDIVLYKWLLKFQQPTAKLVERN